MKILIITSSFPNEKRISGGFLPDLVKNLNKLGCDIHIITQNCTNDKSELRTLWGGCKVTYFKWKGKDTPLIDVINRGISSYFLALSYFIKSIISGYKVSKKWKPDFIYAEWLIPGGVIACVISKLTKIPYAARALGSDVLIATKKRLIKKIVSFVAKNANVLFADGFDLCNKTSQLANGKKCFFAATGRKLENEKSDFNINKNDNFFYICTVGRLHKTKGQDILIKASKILSDKGIKFFVYLVGQGEEYENLNSQIREYRLQDKVILTGRLKDGDIINLYNLVDCVIIPSRSESIPLVLAEAVNAKKPLIVTDVGDMRYLVEEYKLGYVVPSEDYIELASCIEKTIRDRDKKKFIENSDREKLISILSVEKAAKTIYEKFSECINKDILN